MKLHTRILVGLVVGAAAGLGARALPESPWLEWGARNVLEPVGQVFLRLLLMTVVPLIFASLVLGVAGLGDVRRLGRTAAVTMVYFLLSTAAAVAIGLFLAQVVEPGSGIPQATRDHLLAVYRSQTASLQQSGGGIDAGTL